MVLDWLACISKVCWEVGVELFATSRNLLAHAKSARPQMSKHQIQKLDNMVNLDPALELAYHFHYILLAKASHRQVTRPE